MGKGSIYLKSKGLRCSALILLWTFLLFAINKTYADGGRLTASVSSTTVAVGEQIELTFELDGNGKNFQAPSMPDFNVLMGPSSSTSMQIINGSVSQSISYTYILQATKTGTFRIGPASIESGGKRIQSNSLTISVVKGNPQSAGQGRGSTGGGEMNLEKKVFIKAVADKSNVFRGEGIVVTYKLYTQVSLVNYSLNKLPLFEGFFSQEITIPQQAEFHNENLGGLNYKVATIKKVVLFPQRSGNLVLDAMKGQVVARVQTKTKTRSNDPFSQFFNDPFFNNNVQDVKVNLNSEPLNINVRELPSSAPATFTGVVGRFSMEMNVDRREAKAHDAINLKIKISGKGNIKLIDAPKIDFPPDFETYDPKINSTVSANDAGVNGSKSFEYLMIPRNPGEYKVKVSDFSYFDPGKNKYETIPGAEFILKIGKGSETSSTVTVQGVAKSDIQYLGKDIRFIKTATPAFISGNKLFYGTILFYVLLIIPFILFIILLIFRRRYMASQSNTALLKRRKANKMAMKRLSAAQKYLSENNTNAFLDEMFRALWGFVSDKLEIAVSELSKENVSHILSAKGVSEQSIQLFIRTLDACEMGRFARSSAASNEEIYKNGIDVISYLEEEIK